MHRSLAVTVIVVIASLLCSAAASAAPIAPYNGDNPFRCKTQNTGLGVAFPDPDADPFCVHPAGIIAEGVGIVIDRGAAAWGWRRMCTSPSYQRRRCKCLSFSPRWPGTS